MKMAISRARGRGDLEFVDTKPRNDAYTGLLGISLAAMIVGCVLLYLDYDQYGAKKPEPVPATVKTPSGQQPQQPPQRPAGGAAVPAPGPAVPGGAK
jgi:hypothetical protein